MIIRSIRLENIRSYKSQFIEFPEGSVLLSGDIGAGKSTLMLAIEYALFGIKKPYLSGAALLRHGERQGSVELSFCVEKKEIMVKRVLKRAGDDVRQDAGYIVVDGMKTEGTAQELKAKVLEILGYPQDLLTKHKDIIYRYTVYTPQEEMKTIIFEDSEARLETLRRVFGVDKYKRIRENCLVFLKGLKDRKKELSGMIYDLEDKKEQLKDLTESMKAYAAEEKDLLQRLEMAKQKVREAEKEQVAAEQKMRLFLDIRSETLRLESELKMKVARKTQICSVADQLKKDISGLLAKIGPEPCAGVCVISDNQGTAHGSDVILTEVDEIASIEQELLLLSQQLSASQKTLDEVHRRYHEADLTARNSNQTIQKVISIDNCPMCMQAVGAGHKKDIKDREDGTLVLCNKQMQEAMAQKEEVCRQMTAINDRVRELGKKKEMCIISRMNRRSLAEKRQMLERHELEADEIKKEVGAINKKKLELCSQLEGLAEAEREQNKIRIALRFAADEEKRLMVAHARAKNMIDEGQKSIARLQKEVDAKVKAKAMISELSSYQLWLEENFLNLMAVMEKHVMAQVHEEFSRLFSDWFGLLIEDETLVVRLDDEFSPVIEQNGYETQAANLSGGEKTSVALAYRLSLNKVINDMITHIKTRDLIILDEPTDGFSEEQLDKVRDVLELLGARQVIIVSHEAKIESFVDSVIRVSKQQHESCIAQ